LSWSVQESGRKQQSAVSVGDSTTSTDFRECFPERTSCIKAMHYEPHGRLPWKWTLARGPMISLEVQQLLYARTPAGEKAARQFVDCKEALEATYKSHCARHGIAVRHTCQTMQSGDGIYDRVYFITSNPEKLLDDWKNAGVLLNWQHEWAMPDLFPKTEAASKPETKAMAR
jgi:hypothetical protein